MTTYPTPIRIEIPTAEINLTCTYCGHGRVIHENLRYDDGEMSTGCTAPACGDGCCHCPCPEFNWVEATLDNVR